VMGERVEYLRLLPLVGLARTQKWVGAALEGPFAATGQGSAV
jgi:hypothetical protein